MFYSVDLLMTQAKDIASQMALRDCSEDVKGEPRYRFCQKKKKNNNNSNKIGSRISKLQF